MRVPGGAATPSRPVAEDSAKVLKAGQEQPPAQEDIFGDLGDINALLAAEASAPALEREVERGPDDFDDGERELARYATGAPGGAAYEGGGKPKKSNKTIIIVAACVAGVVLLGIVAWFLVGSGPGEGTDSIDIASAKRVAEEYIVLMEDGQVDRATKLLAEELREDDYKDEREAFSKQIGKNNMTEMECTTTHSEEGLEGTEYYLWFNLHYEQGEQEEQSVVVNLRGGDGDFVIVGVGAEDIYGQTVAIGPKSFRQLVDPVVMSEFADFGKVFGGFFCGLLLVLLVLGLVVVVSQWVVFEKAGQPGWAVIVPFYNVWVLAEIGDKPGWWGLAAVFSGGIPYIGPIIELALWIAIHVGVAQAFGRGVLFGLGLTFLPFIFFPILAFSGD
jgi:hypothetical protein